MKTLKLAIPAAVLAAGFMVCTSASYGTPAYAKKEGGKACTTCHVMPPSKKNLNDTGKCYQKNEHKDLDKCPVTPAPDKK
jgi:hypothetical protein